MHLTPPSRLSSGPLSQSGILFGLDARIALTIFAALAAVVGYVSFGRIDIARESALIAELEAFENATNAYSGDMNTFMLFTLAGATPEETDPASIEVLWKPEGIKPGFVKNWHGPYLHRESRKQNTYGTYGLAFATVNRKTTCTEEDGCAAWLSLSNVPAKVWEKVNSYYDEANGSAKEPDGQKTALGRIQADGTGPTRTLYFRLTSRQPTP